MEGIRCGYDRRKREEKDTPAIHRVSQCFLKYFNEFPQCEYMDVLVVTPSFVVHDYFSHHNIISE